MPQILSGYPAEIWNSKRSNKDYFSLQNNFLSGALPSFSTRQARRIFFSKGLPGKINTHHKAKGLPPNILAICIVEKPSEKKNQVPAAVQNA